MGRPSSSPTSPPPDGVSLAQLLEWLEANSATDLHLSAIAARAGLSVRTLSRRFFEQTGTTAMAWLRRTRLRRAQHLLETTAHPIEHIAAQVGFASPTTFREQFRTLVGQPGGLPPPSARPTTMPPQLPGGEVQRAPSPRRA